MSQDNLSNMGLGVKLIAVTVDRSAATRVLQALNDSQKIDGCTLDQTLVSALIVLGSAMKQRGMVLHLDAPLREALPPIVYGYQNEINRRAS